MGHGSSLRCRLSPLNPVPTHQPLIIIIIIIIMHYYLKNALTGLYFNGTNFAAASQSSAEAFDTPPDALWVHYIWGPNARIVREELTAMTFARTGETFTTAGRWVR